MQSLEASNDAVTQIKFPKHLLSIDELSCKQIYNVFDNANQILNNKIPFNKETLQTKNLVNLFFEPSTRTKTSFEISAKKLGLNVVNLDIKHSAVAKGESLLDTLYNLVSLQCDLVVVRHSLSGAAKFLADNSKGVSIINAGDGKHSHPTQGLLDAFSITRHKPNLKDLKVVIVGDIEHSRVARSNISILTKLGVKNINLVAPKTLLPQNHVFNNTVPINNLRDGIANADVIIALRLQKERMEKSLIPNIEEYKKYYCITEDVLKYAKRDSIILHPGPVNRDVEIDSAIVDKKQSIILEQVKNGLAIRMAVLGLIANA